MSKQINSFILPDHIIKDMNDKIRDTKKLGAELGFALCTRKDSNKDHDTVNHNVADHNIINNIITNNDNIITKGSECTGTRCSIKAGTCNENQKQIGSYHTHPRTASTMSITDMVTGCSKNMECIGSARFNNIICFARKTGIQQCLRETSPFEYEEHKILEKDAEIREMLSSPKSIIKTGIYKILKEMYQYDNTVFKYNANRIKLLNRNFDRVNIK